MREQLVIRASDHEYYHPEFHLSMNILLDYLLDRYGEDGVTAYLRRFAEAYHKPLAETLKRGDLGPLEDYFEGIFGKERQEIEVERNANELVIRVPACPGMRHIRARGSEPSECWVETYKTVYSALCEGTPFFYELVSYDPRTGAGTHRFSRRAP